MANRKPSDSGKLLGLAFVAGTLLMVLAGFVTTRETDIRSRAAEEKREAAKNPQGKPSMTLNVIKQDAASVDIGISVNTTGLPTAEADALVSYDPAVLAIGDSDISLLPAYHVINVERKSPGVIGISMFVSDSTDTRFVSSTEDHQVAILHFTKLSKPGQADVNLLFDAAQADTSGIYPPRGEAGGVYNVLSGVQGVSFAVQ